MATAFQNQLENWRIRAQTSQAGEFFRWWVAELRDLLPGTIKERMEHAQRKVIARMEQDELELFWQEADAVQQLEVFSIGQDLALQRQQIADLLLTRELDEAPLELVLPESLVLRKSVQLPLAAEANLRQALVFDLDRHTPFRAEDVYFDYHILNRDKEKAQLQIELVVAPRPPVDAQLEVLEQRAMQPFGVDVALEGKPAGLNLLPFEQRHRLSNRRTRMNLMLGVVAFLVLALVMLQSLWLRDKQLEDIEVAIEEVRIEARRVQNIRTEIEDASEAAGFMLKRRVEVPATVRVLAEVTRILPDNTYLDRLRIWEGNVQMQGKSDNAQQLIETVNLSPLFDDAGFRGSTRLDGSTQKEIFDLSAALAEGSDG